MAPIHEAARSGDDETLRRLLAEGVSPNAVDIDDDEPNAWDDIEEPLRQTPLHVLCGYDDSRNDDNMSGRVACFKLLRDAGANLDATDSVARRHTVLHYAVTHKRVEMVSLLAEAGVNLNAADSSGWTALHFAAMRDDRSYANCVEVLLAAGADLEAKTLVGTSPLRMALEQRSRRAWPLFLRAGAELPAAYPPDLYLGRVVTAGGFKKYAQAHLKRITPTFASVLRLPAQPARRVAEFWLHAGYY